MRAATCSARPAPRRISAAAPATCAPAPPGAPRYARPCASTTRAAPTASAAQRSPPRRRRREHASLGNRGGQDGDERPREDLPRPLQARLLHAPVLDEDRALARPPLRP